MGAFRIGLSGLIFLAASGLSFAGGGVCTTADVDEPFVLPDGSKHPAGLLTLCFKRNFTPVSSFHDALVDRMPVGIFAAGHGEFEAGRDSGYSMLFARGPERALQLVGYTRPWKNGSETYVLNQPRVFVEDSIAHGPLSDERIVLVPAETG